jgi:hypothetical protein
VVEYLLLIVIVGLLINIYQRDTNYIRNKTIDTIERENKWLSDQLSDNHVKKYTGWVDEQKK